MAKYRQKPVIVEAVRFNPQILPWPDGVKSWEHEAARPRDMSWGYIQTPLGKIHMMAGDWIITSQSGEIHICRDMTFRAAYEPVPMEEQH